MISGERTDATSPSAPVPSPADATSSGRAVIFLGPSIPVDRAREVIDADFLPPVAEGDVYRCALTRPRMIGIVDGYFDRVPAVWHKEILWALQQGIHVFGSASMGALRAAELHPFGMEGVGAVFDAFRTGAIEDDDEVAVIHAPAADGYRPLSEAMVNIRATVAAAHADGVVGEGAAVAWLERAKGLHYAERVWPRILQLATGEGVDADEIAALRSWLTAGRVDQKQRDGLEMLAVMRDRLAADPPPKQVTFVLSPTVMWETARLRAGALQGHGDARMVAVDGVLDELRLVPGAFTEVRDALLLRFLARREATRTGGAVDEVAVAEQADALRNRLGLPDGASLADWCDAVGLHRDELPRLLQDEVLIDRTLRYAQDEAYAAVLDHLRLAGRYEEVVDRARRKQRFIDERGLRYAAPADVGLTERELLHWWFVERAGAAVPDDLDAHARAAGFADEDAFHAAVLRERAFVTAPDA